MSDLSQFLDQDHNKKPGPKVRTLPRRVLRAVMRRPTEDPFVAAVKSKRKKIAVSTDTRKCAIAYSSQSRAGLKKAHKSAMADMHLADDSTVRGFRDDPIFVTVQKKTHETIDGSDIFCISDATLILDCGDTKEAESMQSTRGSEENWPECHSPSLSARSVPETIPLELLSTEKCRSALRRSTSVGCLPLSSEWKWPEEDEKEKGKELSVPMSPVSVALDNDSSAVEGEWRMRRSQSAPQWLASLSGLTQEESDRLVTVKVLGNDPVTDVKQATDVCRLKHKVSRLTKAYLHTKQQLETQNEIAQTIIRVKTYHSSDTQAALTNAQNRILELMQSVEGLQRELQTKQGKINRLKEQKENLTRTIERLRDGTEPL